jgi:hypothetical protein
MFSVTITQITKIRTATAWRQPGVFTSLHVFVFKKRLVRREHLVRSTSLLSDHEFPVLVAVEKEM